MQFAFPSTPENDEPVSSSTPGEHIRAACYRQSKTICPLKAKESTRCILSVLIDAAVGGWAMKLLVGGIT
jgi:hypothetical protein